MHARFVLIAAALTSANAYAAEPHKLPDQTAAQSQPAQPRVVLASAEISAATAPAEQSAPIPGKPARIARVTTCRCGDPQPSDADGDQEQ